MKTSCAYALHAMDFFSDLPLTNFDVGVVCFFFSLNINQLSFLRS